MAPKPKKIITSVMANNTAIALSGKFSDCLTATPTPTNIMALEKSQVVPRSQLARDDLRSELEPKNQYKMKHPAPMNNHVINSCSSSSC
jgi:hypothetical protein